MTFLPSSINEAADGCRMAYISETPPQQPRPLFDGESDLITVQRIGEITGLSEQTIRKEINDGRLPACRIGRRLYVPKTELAEYVMKGVGVGR